MKKKKILFFDCFSGMSGDMTLSALIDAGADVEVVRKGLRELIPGEFELEWKRVTKNNLAALKAEILFPKAEKSHHRHFTDIVRMIEKSPLPDEVKKNALDIFTVIGRAEGKIHNQPLEKVHFHEVGALDSILDIVGVALALYDLKPDEIHCAPLPLGIGFTRCEHGRFPVPAPATLEILQGKPVRECSLPYELTTPTGAGIAVSVCDSFREGIPKMSIVATGYGAGTFDIPEQPNVLRVIIGEK